MTDALMLVAGLGSTHGDDQAGWITIDHLQTLLPGRPVLLNRVVARRLSTPLDLLPLFPDHTHILIVDAVQVLPSENPQSCQRIELPFPWTAQSLADSFTQSRSPRLDTHGLGLSQVLQLAQQLQTSPPQVTLFGVPSGNFAAFAPVSPATLKHARTTAAQILAELEVLCRTEIR